MPSPRESGASVRDQRSGVLMIQDPRRPAPSPGRGPVVHPIDRPPTRGTRGAQQPVVQPQPQPPARRRSRHEEPEEHRRYHDYIYVDGYDWWPRWFPYWDPAWYQYWQYLFSYYQGDRYPEYASQARDQFLRAIAPRYGWQMGASAYAGAQVGMQPYGVAQTQQYQRLDQQQLAQLRERGLDKARRAFATLDSPYVGFRSTSWGGEITVFGSRAGLQRWANEQARAADPDVWYAAAFDVSQSMTPLTEIAR